MNKLEQKVANLEKIVNENKNLNFLDQMAVWWTGAGNIARVLIIMALFAVLGGAAVGLAFGLQALGITGIWTGVATAAIAIPGIFFLIKFLGKIL